MTPRSVSPESQPLMSKKKLISIELVEKNDQRFIVSTYADGTKSREPVVPKKATRRPMRPFKKVKIDHTKLKRF